MTIAIILLHVVATVVVSIIVAPGWICFIGDLLDGEEVPVLAALLEVVVQAIVYFAIWFHP